ncbi:MAG: hypothetical protein M1839_006165 [Geoglossum umbratile]|nr:MAG: hypothetical protein M1839_006165 [Geoglossum umbratile]
MKVASALCSLLVAAARPLPTTAPAISIIPQPSILASAIASFRPTLGRNASPTPTTFVRCMTRKSERQKKDMRITLLRYHLTHPLTPRPLRFGRLRALRHWTIHRAYQLYQHNLRAARERELERQYNSMREACEALRLLPGDQGRLFRIAMGKKGIKAQGVPLEYARAPTEWPSKTGWNAGWVRGG